MSSVTDIQAWILARAPGWRLLVDQVGKMRAHRSASVEEALIAVESYRGLARDLATARRVAPQSRTTAALESLYSQLHSLINRKPSGNRHAVSQWLRVDIPRSARELRGGIFNMVALMALSGFAGWWLISTYPDLIGLIAGPVMIEKVQQGHLWTEGIMNITPSSLLSVNILANNIAVSIMAFCAGISLGLATFYLIGFNGLMLGAIFAFVHQHDLALNLFTFIIAHGPVELSVICIAGACGVALGESIIRPQLATRRESFQACAHRVAPLMLLCAALLVGCGFIEGFISPDPIFPLASRIVIGVAYFSVMLMLLSGRLLRTPATTLGADG